MIYYDVTDLVRHAQHSLKVTGIQRVVLEGMRGLQAQALPMFLSPVTGKWYVLENFDATGMDDLVYFTHLWERADLVAYPTRANVRRYLSRAIGDERRLTGMHRQLVKLPFLRRKLNRYTARFSDPAAFVDRGWPHIRPMPSIHKGDKLVLFGTPWNAQASYEKLLSTMDGEAERVFLIYDLIPLNSPYVPDELRDSFRAYIPFVLRNATSVIVNSDSAGNDLRAFALAHSFKVPVIKKINLAHHLPPRPLLWDSTLRVRKLFTEKYALCVGSIESRKNHLNLLTTWSRFVRSTDYAGEKLVIAGGWAWDYAAIQNLLHDTGHVYGSVIVIEQPSDDELRKLYTHCRFTAYPSHYEGWGLPVGESLSFGKPCLHFDNSSLREAGRGLTDVVPYHDLDWYYRAFRRLMIDDRYYRKQCDNINTNMALLRSWSDFSNDVKSVINSKDLSKSLL